MAFFFPIPCTKLGVFGIGSGNFYFFLDLYMRVYGESYKK